MPYILPEKRECLDNHIDDLVSELKDLDSLKTKSNNMEGNMNYVITRLLREVYGTYGGYENINNAMGVLNCVAMEYYTRCAIPYEDNKKFENGDVEPTVSDGIMDSME